MSQSFDIAVVGATGLVGEALLMALDEREFPVGSLYPLASDAAVGQVAAFRERNLRVRAAADFDFASVALVFLVEPLPAAQLARIEAAGCALVDLSGTLEASVNSLSAPVSVISDSDIDSIVQLRERLEQFADLINTALKRVQ